MDGDPADVTTIMQANCSWLKQSPTLKLFVNGNPGSMLTGEKRDYCRTFPNQAEVTVDGLYALQEDSGVAIGQAIVNWKKSLWHKPVTNT